MSTSSQELGYLGILKWNLDFGFFPALLVVAGGEQAIVQADSIMEIESPKGRTYLYGDFIAVSEEDIELTLSSEDLDSVTLMMSDGSVVRIESYAPLRAAIIN